MTQKFEDIQNPRGVTAAQFEDVQRNGVAIEWTDGTTLVVQRAMVEAVQAEWASTRVVLSPGERLEVLEDAASTVADLMISKHELEVQGRDFTPELMDDLASTLVEWHVIKTAEAQ